MNLTLCMIGLGRMGGNMSRRIARAGHTVVAWDRALEARTALGNESRVLAAATLEALVAKLPSPKIAWLMLPAGAPTEDTLRALVPLLSRGDIVVDGANAMYRDSQRHAAELGEHGIQFVDAGVSGGVWGLENGYGLMVGGDSAAVGAIRPVLQALAPAPDRGWVHCGPVGAGHFTKMVHNGIEYGLMQAYAEGFALLHARDDLVSDVAAVAEAWREGTVIRSWLLDLAAGVLHDDQSLDDVAPEVADSGEGRWTVHEAVDLGVPVPVITAALYDRFASQGHADYGDKLLAKLRHAFGGHPVNAADKAP